MHPLLLLAPLGAHAAPADKTPPEVEPPVEDASLAWREHVRPRAYVETYVSFDSSMPEDHRRPQFLYSYARTTGVTVNLARLGAELDSPDVRGAALLAAGTFMEDNQGFEEPGLQNVNEAWVGVRLAGETWLDAGIFPSHLGAESAIGLASPTLTRSLTAENSPYYLAGFKVITAIGDNLELGVVGANGWQTIRQTTPPGLGGGTWVTWTPDDAVTLNWSTWVGYQQPEAQVRLFNDLYATVTLERLDLIAWVDVGAQGGAVWGGGNAQARGWLTENVGVSFRIERFSDPAGLVVQLDGTGTTLWGGSVGVDVALRPLLDDGSGQAMWRLEARTLRSERATFDGRPTNHAVTTSLAVGF